MALRADVYSAADVLQATIDSLGAVKITESLDKIGSCDIQCPATDPGTQYLTAGAYIKLYDTEDGYLGTFLYEDHQLGEGGGQATLSVRGADLLEELTRTSVHFWRNYDNTAVETVVSALVALASGWSDGDIDTGIGNTTITYHGESVFIAVDALRDRWNQHFRQGSTDRTLDFGAFGTASGIRLVKAENGVPPEMEQNAQVAIVTDIEVVEESEEIFNRVIPLGGGQGKAQLTIEGSTAGDYTTETGTNADSSSFYYIEDSDSVTAYGRREKVLSFPNIRPISNNDTAIGRARDALKLAAEAYMARHVDPRITYHVAVTGLDGSSLQVGDTVRLRYKGLVTQRGELYRYIDVDADFYVMDIYTARMADERVSVDLNISSIADRRTADSDVMIGVMHDLKAIKVNVQPAPANYKMGPFTRRMDSSNTGDFTLRVNTEVMEIISCRMYFQTSPLRASATGAASGGGSTSGSSSQSTTSSGGSSNPTSASGTPGTTTSGASSSSTTASGGSSNPTSASGTPGTTTSQTTTPVHNHSITVINSTSGNNVTFIGSPQNTIACSGGGTMYTANAYTGHTHSINGSDLSHTHTVSIPNHSHGMDHTHNIDGGDLSHTHSVSIPNHSHGMQHTHSTPNHTHNLSYGLYEDNQYPTSISVTIDGTDRTSALGGPWDVGGSGADVGPLDITDYLSTTPSIRQNHTIVFSCSSGRGEIECEADLLTVIQAIAVS